MTNDDEFNERIAKVGAAYKDHLAQLLVELMKLQTQIAVSGQFKQARGDVRDIVHRIAGSAALFQFENVGRAAEQVEIAILEAKRGGYVKGSDKLVLQLLDDLIEMLKTSLK